MPGYYGHKKGNQSLKCITEYLIKTHQEIEDTCFKGIRRFVPPSAISVFIHLVAFVIASFVANSNEDENN